MAQLGERHGWEGALLGTGDTCLYTAPGRYGGGGAATTWLVGSPAEVADALAAYAALGITHFIVSDTPYRSEIPHLGDQLLGVLGQKLG